MSNLSTEIESNAQDAESVTVDGVTVKNRSIKDQIEADRYLASKTAAASAKRGFSISKLSPPGTA